MKDKEQLLENLEKIKYWVIDVDGTLTDGGIYYDSTGNEIKKFSVRDAAGIFAAHAVNMLIIVITGRECLATQRRLEELHIDYYYQNIKEKYDFLEKFMKEHNLVKEEMAYIGDDLNDYDAMMLTGFIACPSDACEEIQQIADYKAEAKGGYGAVREVINFVLKARNQWNEAVKKAYKLR